VKYIFDSISGSTAYVGNKIVLNILNNINPPTVTTTLAINTTKTTSYIGGIVDTDTTTLLDRGICWGTGSTPTINDNIVSGGSTYGSFDVTVTNIPMDTQFYYRAYARNAGGVGYGSTGTTKTYMDETITDYDGNVYNIIKINHQKWLAQDLKTTHLNDGTPIPYLSGNTSLSGYSWYDNDIVNKDIYGALYTGYMAYNNKTAPIGCHIPTVEEVSELAYYASGLPLNAYTSTNTASVLKEAGFTHWREEPSAGISTNSTNFTALPNGYRLGTSYTNLLNYGYMRTSTLSSFDDYSNDFSFSYANTTFGHIFGYKTTALAIRCIVDQTFDKPTVTTSASVSSKTGNNAGERESFNSGASRETSFGSPMTTSKVRASSRMRAAPL
jgi:uncharacterized protein (TIGR02145 family)